MDGRRFDELSRIVGAAPSRRAVLKGLAGGLVAGLAALTGRGAAAQTRQANGAACTRATQCASLKCVDGVCCNATCTGQCEACTTGTCLPVTGAPVGTRPACTGTGVCQASCDGVTPNQCTAYPGLDVVCADPDCEGGWLTTYGCGGDGTCHPTTTSCDPFGCDATGTACATSCTDGQCPGRPLGDPCGTDTECASGFCVNGVCCVERCAECQVCNLPGNVGFCGPAVDGGTCAAGICCDGDCADTQTDVEHCGACDNSCLANENSRAICVRGACDTECLPGFFELNGACRCDNLILSGGPNPATPLEVDDDLSIFLNGSPIFQDTNGLQDFHPPIAVPGQFGDQLRVVATDVQGAEWALSPLYLHCVGTGVVQVLDAAGFRICCSQPVGGVFYDETFTIAI